MEQPERNSSPDAILRPERTFFATTNASIGRRFFHVDRNAELLIDVLRSLVAENAFRLHDFVIMPDQVHLLLTIDEDMTIQKAMRLIKGRFSYRLSRETGRKDEVWQSGFSEVQVMDRESFLKHCEYIAASPIKAGLVRDDESYPYCYRTLADRKAAEKAAVERQIAQGLKLDIWAGPFAARLNSCPVSRRQKRGITNDKSE